MKSTMFKKIINEELIEVNKSVPETIQCLRDQTRTCNCSLPNDMMVVFKCTKKGKITMLNNFGYSRRAGGNFNVYYVGGKVISRDNKTYVQITSIYKKSDLLFRILSTISFLLLVPFLILFKIYVGELLFFPAIIAYFLVYILTLIDEIKTVSTIKKNGLEIVKIMEDEITKRVENIEHWDK
ncbi:MAG: hypothetical protein E7568_04380 [Ruminococcaceae bacterium]|nr:hypothetical protein [Oscillospiraceae bacterium]